MQTDACIMLSAVAVLTVQALMSLPECALRAGMSDCHEMHALRLSACYLW